MHPIAFEPTTMAVAAFIAEKALVACVSRAKRPIVPCPLKRPVKSGALKRIQTRTLRRVQTWMSENKDELREVVTEEVAEPLLTWVGPHPITIWLLFIILLCFLVY